MYNKYTYVCIYIYILIIYIYNIMHNYSHSIFMYNNITEVFMAKKPQYTHA